MKEKKTKRIKKRKKVRNTETFTTRCDWKEIKNGSSKKQGMMTEESERRKEIKKNRKVKRRKKR